MSKDEPQARGGFALLGDVALLPAGRPGTGAPRSTAPPRLSAPGKNDRASRANSIRSPHSIELGWCKT